jgi:cytochrome c peroxidase
MHQANDVCIDSFQADRGPDHRYRTAPIGALSTHLKGGFYHDGRFADLKTVVNHYNTCMNLGLASGEKSDLVQYLLSLKF